MDLFAGRHSLGRPFRPAFVTEALDRLNKASERRAEFVKEALRGAAKQKQSLLSLDYAGQLSTEVAVAVGGMRQEFEGKLSLLDQLLRDAVRKSEERDFCMEELAIIKHLRVESCFFQDTIAYLSQIRSNLHLEKVQLKKKAKLLSSQTAAAKQELRGINMNNIRLYTLINGSQPTSYSLSPKHRHVLYKPPSLSVTPASRHFSLLREHVIERGRRIRRARQKTWIESQNRPLEGQKNEELRTLFKECVSALPEFERVASKHRTILRDLTKRNRLSLSFQDPSKQPLVGLNPTEMLALLRASSSLQASLLSATLC